MSSALGAAEKLLERALHDLARHDGARWYAGEALTCAFSQVSRSTPLTARDLPLRSKVARAR